MLLDTVGIMFWKMQEGRHIQEAGGGGLLDQTELTWILHTFKLDASPYAEYRKSVSMKQHGLLVRKETLSASKRREELSAAVHDALVITS